MKKILFLLTIVIASLSAKPCMTDIYFGNGVWNPDRDAVRKVQLRGLKILMENNQPNIFNQNNEGKNYQWRVAFNPSYGTIDDLIETFWQLKESGQITEGYFGAVYASLTWEQSNEFYNKLEKIITKYNNDISTMFTLYSNESFNQKHNVLLVAHSQGNLFGNKMYTLMSDVQKKKFRMVSVGTPADHVMNLGQTSPYVTLYGDFVIRPISGSLPANTNGGGHSFLGAYLAKIDARIKIGSYVKSAYDNLMQTTSCTEYDYVYLYLDYLKDSMRVVGKIANVFENEVIAEVPLVNIVNTGTACGSSYPLFFMHPNLVMQVDDSALWDISPFETENEVLLKEFTVLKYATIDNKCVTVSFSDTLFDAVHDALDRETTAQ